MFYTVYEEKHKSIVINKAMKKLFFLLQFLWFSCSLESNLATDVLRFDFLLQHESWKYALTYYDNGIIKEACAVELKNYKEFIVKKGKIFPVLCEMQSLSYPAKKIKKGFVYPLSSEMNELDGFIAEIILMALSWDFSVASTSERNVQFFNWCYFKEKLQEVENLDELDKYKIAEGIACGKFSVKLLR